MAYASNNYDLFRLTDSELSGNGEPMVFQEKEVVEINDSQQGGYTGGQITYDLKPIQSGDYLDTCASYVVIPVTVTVVTKGTTTASQMATGNDAAKRYCAGIKGGDFNIINGMSVVMDGNTVVPLINLSNIHMNFKLINELDDTALKTLGESFGYFPDTPTSITWSDSYGEINNNVVAGGVGTNITESGLVNEGLFRRNRAKFFYPTGYTRGDSANQMRLNTLTINQNNTTFTTTLTYTFFCTIQLPVLHDFFRKLPIGRGYNMQITLSTHLPSSFGFTATGDATNPTTTYFSGSAFTSVTNYGFQPFMLATPMGSANTLVYPMAMASATTAATTCLVSITGSIGTQANSGSTQMSSSTMYLAMVRPIASVEAKLIAHPKRMVRYTDILQMQPSALQNVVSGGNVWAEIITNIGSVRSILIVPHIPPLANGSSKVDSLASAMTSAGSTTAVQSYMYQLQVRQSGRNVWNRDGQYVTNEYLRLSLGNHATNGNGYMGTTSGLYGELGYRTGNGYQWINLARKPEGVDKLAVSLSITFQNLSSLTLSYLIFVEYEKEFEVNTVTGKLTI